jgi:hypothetical protein
MTELNTSTAVAAIAAPEAAPSAQTFALILNESHMAQMFKFAEMMACGIATVPKHLQKNPADCLAVVMQATQWGMNPFAVAQKTHIVNGALGYEAQLVNAVLQSTKAVQSTFAYEYRGTDAAPECRVGAVIAGQQAITWGEWLSAATVTTKNSPLWKTNPKQQLGYLQVKNWARSFCPGAILGVYTSEELEEAPVNKHMGAVEIVPPAVTALPTWPEDKFAERLPKWKEAIAGGKTADGVITAALTKGALTDDQMARIKALPAQVVKEAGPRKPDGRTGPVVVTYAQVADALHKAQDMDKLNDAAALINAIDDLTQQAELNAMYDQRAAALN